MPSGQAHHFLSTFPPCRFLSLHRALVSTSKFRQWVEPVAFAHVSFPFPATLRMTSARCLYGYGVGVGDGVGVSWDCYLEWRSGSGVEIYLEGGGQTSLPTEGIQKSKEEGKTVLSVGAPGTLAGFASLIFFFSSSSGN